jgi:3,4-dihydroxy 2-butanone 4-phosphate synthase/GTP cyclohydrolase II
VHVVNLVSDLLGAGEEGDGGTLLAKAMRAVAREGRGVVILIRDLAPRGVSEWIQRRTIPEPGAKDARERRRVEIGVGSQILRHLGVGDMILLSNSPAHVYVGLEAFGLRIVGTRRIE